MSAHEDKLNEFLKSMGFAAPLAPWPEVPGAKVVVCNHMGLNLIVALEQDALIYVQDHCGYLPKVNTAPFYRRLLTLNASFIGAYFCVFEADDALVLRTSRLVDGLDFVEFKAMLDTLGALHWQYMPSLAQEFQIL
jgi:hypothetical protein